MSGESGRRKTLTGVVMSDVNDKNVVIKVERRFPHPKYGKMVSGSLNGSWLTMRITHAAWATPSG